MAIFGPLGDEDPEIDDVELELPTIEPEASMVDDVPEDIFATDENAAEETPEATEAPGEEGEEPPAPDEPKQKKNKKSAKARIDEIYGKWREEERQKNEAIQVATQLYQRMQQLEQQAGAYAQNAFTNELKSLDSEIDKAERDYLRAREDGDLQAEAKASRLMGQLAAKRERTEAMASVQPQPQQRVPQQQPAYQQPAPSRQPPAKAVEWAQKNDGWFRKDPEATRFAINYSNHLLTTLGVSDHDDAHYAMVDAAVKAKFPQVLESYDDEDEPAPKAKPRTSPVAGVGARAPVGGKIRLSDNPQFMAAVQVAKEMDPRIDTKDPKVLQDLYKSFTKDKRK